MLSRHVVPRDEVQNVAQQYGVRPMSSRLILDTPSGQVRVHACRDVSARGVSGYRLGLGWGSHPLLSSSAEGL